VRAKKKKTSEAEGKKPVKGQLSYIHDWILKNAIVFLPNKREDTRWKERTLNGEARREGRRNSGKEKEPKGQN